MTANLSFSLAEVLWGVGLFSVAFLVFIALWRRYFNRVSSSDLAEKYKDKQWKSPLEARNKYPDVNVFRYSGVLLRVSLIVSLGLIVALFNITTPEKQTLIPEGAADLLVNADIEVEPPRTAEPPPPPPPPPPPVIEEVPDNLILEEEVVDFVDQSIDANTSIDFAPKSDQTSEKSEYVAPPPPPPAPTSNEREIFKVVEEMPRFPGCENLPTMAERKACADKKMLEFIYANIEYPQIARENNIEGTVVVRFVVDKDGNVGEAEVIREIGGGCGEEAMRVVDLMGQLPEKWVPGKQRGRPVNVYFTLPVRFILKVDP